MPNRDAILLETVKTHRTRLTSAFVHGELTERRLANDNVRRFIGGMVLAAVLCAGCVGFSFVASVLGKQAADAQTQAGLGPATGPVFVADTFDRRTQRGWGTAERGGRWKTSGDRDDFSTDDGTARVEVGDDETRSALLARALQDRSDVTVTMRRDEGARDGTVTAEVIARRVSGRQDYRADVSLRDDGSVRVSLTRRAEPGTSGEEPEQTLSPTVILAGPENSDDSPPADVRVRVQAIGTSPTTLRAKVWSGAGSEPEQWTVTASDDTDGLQRPGAVGLEVSHNGDDPADLLVSDLVGRVAP